MGVLGGGLKLLPERLHGENPCSKIRQARDYVGVLCVRGLKMEPEDSYGEKLGGKSYVQVYMWQCLVVKNKIQEKEFMRDNMNVVFDTLETL